jgi:hypothetical protein
MDRPVKKENNQLPATPLTLDGSYILPQMFRIRWAAWRALGASQQKHILTSTASLFTAMAQHKQEGTGLFSMLGHKGDLMVVHFRKSLERLNDAELTVARSELFEYLDPITSYLSVIELGLYDASLKLYSELTAKGVAPGAGECRETRLLGPALPNCRFAARRWRFRCPRVNRSGKAVAVPFPFPSPCFPATFDAAASRCSSNDHCHLQKAQRKLRIVGNSAALPR